MRIQALTCIGAALAISACRPAEPATSPPPRETRPALPALPEENELTLYGPDPLIRTRVRMQNSQIHLRRYCESNGRYPAFLAEALPPGRREWGTSFDFDAWDNPLLYQSTGSRYELRSAGPDGLFHTADDLIGTSLPVADADSTAQSNPCAAAPASASPGAAPAG